MRMLCRLRDGRENELAMPAVVMQRRLQKKGSVDFSWRNCQVGKLCCCIPAVFWLICRCLGGPCDGSLSGAIQKSTRRRIKVIVEGAFDALIICYAVAQDSLAELECRGCMQPIINLQRPLSLLRLPVCRLYFPDNKTFFFQLNWILHFVHQFVFYM